MKIFHFFQIFFLLLSSSFFSFSFPDQTKQTLNMAEHKKQNWAKKQNNNDHQH